LADNGNQHSVKKPLKGDLLSKKAKTAKNNNKKPIIGRFEPDPLKVSDSWVHFSIKSPLSPFWNSAKRIDPRRTESSLT